MIKINTLKIFFLVVFGFFSLVVFVKPALSKKEFSYKEEKEISHTMRMLQMDTENLHIAFEKRDWDQIGKLTQSIHDGCSGLESRAAPDVPPEFDDFKILGENLHDYAEELITASKKKDIETAKASYKKMEKTCVNCHKIFRN